MKQNILMRLLPLFSIWIELPYFELRNEIMSYAYESRILRYYCFHIKLHKWHIDFTLFKPDEKY